MQVFKRFHQVTVAVRDLDASVAGWENVFGDKAVQDSEVHDPGDAGVRRARFDVGDAWLELAQPPQGETPLGRFLQAYGQGVYSVSVVVDDIDALVNKACQAGARVVSDKDPAGEVYIDPASTNGVLLGLRPEGPSDVGSGQNPHLFKRIHHLVVATTGAKGAIANWKGLFGVEPVPEPANANQVFAHHMPVGRAWFGLAEAEGYPPGTVDRFLRDRGEGVYAVSLVVNDVKKTAGAIRERGGRILGSEDGPGQVFVSPATTHGVLLELSEDTSRSFRTSG